jgi:hypothetical protein
MQQIADWLKKLGMSEYTDRFVENRIDLSVLPDLTDQDLEKLGVLLGDRRKMLRAIRNLDNVSVAATAPAATVEPEPTRRDDAERRQLTVMFTDLVGSTALSARLDPEDLRGIIGVYHHCCADLVERHGGRDAGLEGPALISCTAPYLLFWRCVRDTRPKADIRLSCDRQRHNFRPIQPKLAIDDIREGAIINSRCNGRAPSRRGFCACRRPFGRVAMHVHDPVEAVLDGPMCANDRSKLGGSSFFSPNRAMSVIASDPASTARRHKSNTSSSGYSTLPRCRGSGKSLK